MLRVVIADDSSFFREVLREVLEAGRDISVVGEAPNGEEAVRLVESLAPDLVTLDIRMPGMDGLAAVEKIMSVRPTPILVLSAQPSGPGSSLVFDATRRGALGVWEKRQVGQDYEGGSVLRDQVRQLARVRVVRHVAMPAPAKTPPPAAVAPRAAASTTAAPPLFSPPANPVATPRVAPPEAPRLPVRPLVQLPRVIGIGASAGGPPALATVLGALPRDFPACVVVVQHIPAGFADSFESFLKGCTPLKVVSVASRARAVPGTVLLPADDRHLMAVGPDTFAASDAPLNRGHRPSVDTLFFSLAQVFGRDAAGVLLTGMGDDGARGLAAMKARGSLTVAQDEGSSVVWGMPRAAVDLKAVDEVLSLTEIATLLGGGR